ncbi:LPS assembly lipoprotein LptE [Halomonas huangheensis]|uniref:LPS-assembly lipoprotein LptE n=1 Tax=Halomonas huangheensis TaxID=1178482 RepID=W1N1Y5_9GAMM|nr:LPS assembly lipoprotein LptE [Halomonas huangheensis]ALM52270.1 hypothetical protein AR456_08195 [Halomonas huangheensis]ERL49498.1 hypothetical protein BJB45_06875 [Halomonas huangheensis]
MLQRRQFLGFTLSAGLALALAGCGFHLRGLDGDVLSLDQLAIAGPGAESPFAEQLIEQLEAHGTQVTDNAPLRLNLNPEDSFIRAGGILNSGGQDETVVLNIPYSIQRTADSAYLVSRETLETTDTYTLQDGNLLSRDDLREEAQDRARREAVRQMIDRLRALPLSGDAAAVTPTAAAPGQAEASTPLESRATE